MPNWLSLLCLTCACLAFGLPANAQDDDPQRNWRVTIEDFHGGSGVTNSHIITPQSIRTVRTTDVEDDEPVELSTIELDARQVAAIRQVLNRIPLDELEESYFPRDPLLGGSVCFVFELPNREKQEVVVWQGAHVPSLRRVVDQINRILPRELRIRAMDR